MDRVCPACGASNQADTRFCTACGRRFAEECPNCGRAAVPGDRFCGSCGRPIGEPAAGPAPAAPVPSAPALVGERKQVTVLFADVAGSMQLAEGVDPEDWAELMDRFFRVLSDGVVRFGGTVDKFTGDGIMALFGAPVSQEDHASRACAAALALREAGAGLGLAVRLGINSGEAVVGGIGPEGRPEYTALGHTVGLAQRMEALAEPGSACLTEHTARLVRGRFTLRDLGLVEVKGSSQPVRVYALDGAARRSRTGGGSAALVGRSEELGTLETALARAREGQGQVIGIVGEAGVGKSRLCEEFARSASARGITVRRATGVSHARDVPLLPVLDFLRDYFAILDTDSKAEARRKIADRLLTLDPSLEGDLPLLFDFLQVPDEAPPPLALSAEVRLDRIFALLRRATQRRSDRETLLLLLEDLHWFDPASQDFIERLIPSFPGTRTLVVTNFRPEFSPPWSSHSYYRQLPLAPLDPEAVGRLLTALLGRDDSLAPVVGLISEATGGSPFFVEEVVRSLVEDRTLVGEPGAYRLARPVGSLQVPATVQATLAARIDRLPETDKAVLQTAAVVGRHFSAPVVRLAADPGTEGVGNCLGRLCVAEFLQIVPDAPVEEYRFWHPLTQEVAYRSMLRERRAAIHSAVARAIIATDPDRLDERAALLATHFDRAGDHLEAARWNARAGDFALPTDVGEALSRWRAALHHLGSVPETEDAATLGIQARQRLIRYLARIGSDPDEVAQLYADAHRMAERLGDPAQLAGAVFGYGTTKLMRGDLPATSELYRRAAELADQSGDPEIGPAFTAIPGLPIAWTGPVGVGLDIMARARDRLRGNPDVGVRLIAISPLSVVTLIEAHLLALVGRGDDAWEVLQWLVTGPRSGVDAEFVVWGWAIAARVARTAAELKTCLEACRDGARNSENAGSWWTLILALSGIGVAELRQGRFTPAVEAFERAVDEIRRRGTARFDEARNLAFLAQARLGAGDVSGALDAGHEAVAVARRQGARILECDALLTRARILRASGAGAEAVDVDLSLAAALARDTGASAYDAEIEAERALPG